MKTKTQVINDSGINSKLINSVLRQLGDKSYLKDIANHGASAGFPGFTYYSDTVSFYKRNRAAIKELIERIADDLGENPIEMIAAFNCLGGQDMKRGNFGYEEDRQNTLNNQKILQKYYPSIARCLYGRITHDDTTIANALAWFALEEIAHAFSDE